MSALSEACRHPFSNGTERMCWSDKWCDYCEHDHGISHVPDPQTNTDLSCDLLLEYDVSGGETWPEAWLPEPDDGHFFLPSRMVCAAFKPCHLGKCNGDPGADERAERVAEVTAYWRDRS